MIRYWAGKAKRLRNKDSRGMSSCRERIPTRIEQISEKPADDLVGEELTAKESETKGQKQRQKHDQAHGTVWKPREKSAQRNLTNNRNKQREISENEDRDITFKSKEVNSEISEQFPRGEAGARLWGFQKCTGRNRQTQ